MYACRPTPQKSLGIGGPTLNLSLIQCLPPELPSNLLIWARSLNVASKARAAFFIALINIVIWTNIHITGQFIL